MSPWNTVSKADHNPQWNPLQWDSIAQFYPWRVFYARSIKSGHIPLWNPHQFCGTPFLANGQSAVLYPLNLVFLVFDPITAFTVFAFLHLFLAAVFMYLLMRELGCRDLGALVGAISFTFSAFMVLWLELPTFISAAVYLPLTLLLIQRAINKGSKLYGALAGASIALAFLSGHFQIAFYVLLAAALWWVWKLDLVSKTDGKLYTIFKFALPCAACFVFFALIAAPQIIPSQELAKNSHRVRAITSQGYTHFVGNGVGIHWLITAFTPDFYGNPSANNYFLGSAADYMEYGLYIGILPLMLAIVALGRIRKQKHISYFAALGLIAILTATGTAINYIFYYGIPGFTALGGPNRILLLYFFAIAALAGFGIDYFVDHATDRIKWRGKDVSAGAIAALAAVLVIGILFAAFNSIAVGYIQSLTGTSFDGAMGPSGRIFVAFFLASALVLLTRASSSLNKRLFAVISIALITADLFAFGINYNPTCERSKVYPQTRLTSTLKSLAGNNRIAPINPTWSLFKTPNAILPPNAAMVYGLYDVQGYDSLFTKAYKDLSSRVQQVDSSPPENGNMVLMRRYTDSVGKLASVIVSRDPIAGLKLADRVDGLYIYNTGAVAPKQQPYEPYSFRFGLFLMCVGVGALCFAGVYHILKRTYVRK